jgi:poly(A) polymerase
LIIKIDNSILNRTLFRKMSELAHKQNVDIFLVGGFVRDILLNRVSKDIDIMVLGEGLAFAEKVAECLPGKPKLSFFKKFGTANLKSRDYEIEFVEARKESYTALSRKPEVEKGSFKDDIARRDFTINSLAVSLNDHDYGTLIDLYGGLEDLKKRIIRTPLEPDRTFSDDPLRMMRAVRFCAQLDFDLHPETREALKRNRERIRIVSYERISYELNKIISSHNPAIGFTLLQESGLLPVILPEVSDLEGVETLNQISHKENFEHSLQVLTNVARYSENIWLRWTALLHDIGKPLTKKFDATLGWTFHGHEFAAVKMIKNIFRRLKMPMGDELNYVLKIVVLHHRPAALTHDEVSDSAVRRLIVDAGKELDDLLLFCKADITSKNRDRVKKFHEHFEMVERKIKEVEQKDQLRNWKNPISGDIIMDTFNIGPGILVGEIKELVKDAIMDGLIPNDFDQAFDFMLRAGEERGLKRKNT